MKNQIFFALTTRTIKNILLLLILVVPTTLQNLYGQKRVTKKELKTSVQLSTLADSTIVDNEKTSNTNLSTNVSGSRYFISPTAIGLKRGEGYYQNYLLSNNQFNYGLTNHISMGISLNLFPLSIIETASEEEIESGSNDDLVGFMISPMYTSFTKDEIFNVGFGGLIINRPNTKEVVDIFAMYGCTTIGTKLNNFTLGFGIDPRKPEDYDPDAIVSISITAVIFAAAGSLQVGKQVALITDNWAVVHDEYSTAFFSLGARYLGKRFSLDLAIVGSTPESEQFNLKVSPIPLIGLNIPFKNNRGR